MAGEFAKSDEHSAQIYEHLLCAHHVADKIWRSLELDKHLLARRRKLNVHFGERRARPGLCSILGKIDARTVQSFGRTVSAKRDWHVITDSHQKLPLYMRTAVGYLKKRE
jgi:hypothetical protein